MHRAIVANLPIAVGTNQLGYRASAPRTNGCGLGFQPEFSKISGWKPRPRLQLRFTLFSKQTQFILGAPAIRLRRVGCRGGAWIGWFPEKLGPRRGWSHGVKAASISGCAIPGPAGHSALQSPSSLVTSQLRRPFETHGRGTDWRLAAGHGPPSEPDECFVAQLISDRPIMASQFFTRSLCDV